MTAGIITMGMIPENESGQQLVKQNLITKEELAEAKRRAEASGMPWYKQLIQMGKVNINIVEDVLTYEFHSRDTLTTHISLGETLLGMGAVTKKQLNDALKIQKRNGRLLGRILLDQGHVTEDQIAKALGIQFNIPYAKLSDAHSSPEALAAVPINIALRNNMLPIHLEGDKLTVLITNPQDAKRLKDAGTLIGKHIEYMITAAVDIQANIQQRYQKSPQYTLSETTPLEANLNQMINQNKKETLSVTSNNPKEKDKTRFEEIARQAQGATVVQLVTTIIEGAVNSGATDVHLDPQDPEMRVRFRIDGVLHDVMSIQETLESAVISRIKIMSDLDITNTRHPQDGHISMNIKNREWDLRVATLPTYLGERVVLRLLDQSSVLAGIKDLGMELADEKRFTRLIEQPYGMILVTGPTGSGKTTTLYAALNQKNVLTDSIVTLEDPVEYQISGINQVQIDPDIGLTFASTLRAALRQDIDVLLVGEIRDAETAHIAIRASMTGHLVFSTLHTNDSIEVISTFHNMGIPPYLIASALTAVIGQRLVRTICEDCKKSFTPTTELIKSIGLPLSVKKLYTGKGCENCYLSGSRGRTGIFEVLEITPELRKLIANNVNPDLILKASKMKAMSESCREKVKKGQVPPEEYLRVIRI